MIEESILIIGKCYFRLMYHDKDLLVPDICTLIYIGKNLYTESEKYIKDYWFFQDPKSYSKYGPANKEPVRTECEVHRFDAENLFSIYDWDGLIKELSENKEAQDKGEIFN